MSWILDSLARGLARSRRATRWAALVRNQAERVLQFHFAASFAEADAADESWLAAAGPAIGTFLDVGANRGDWTAALLRHASGARGVLFEPGGVGQRASARFAGDANVRLEPVAMGERSGTATLHESASADQSSSLVPGMAAGDVRAREVQVVTLEDALAAFPGRAVDACKVDCEGWDLDVLRGGQTALREGRIGALQFEYNTHWRARGATLEAARRLLADGGYELLLLRREGLFELPSGRYGEYFAYSNYLALQPAHPLAARLAPLRRGRGGY